MIKIDKLNPFGRLCVTLGMLPSSYKESLTYEEQLLWMLNYIEKTLIPTINNNAQAVEELQALYLELKSYVDNYFTNLDVQQEINNKLDQMAESGQLTDIIAQYLGLAGVLAYDTKNDMKNAQNLANGSICKTLGYNNINDGKGEYYKIRTLTSSDVVDEINIIALTNYPTLIAEKVNNEYVQNIKLKNYYINNANVYVLELKNISDIKVIASGGDNANPENNIKNVSEFLQNNNEYDLIINGGTFSVSNNKPIGYCLFDNVFYDSNTYPNNSDVVGFDENNNLITAKLENIHSEQELRSYGFKNCITTFQTLIKNGETQQYNINIGDGLDLLLGQLYDNTYIIVVTYTRTPLNEIINYPDVISMIRDKYPNIKTLCVLDGGGSCQVQNNDMSLIPFTDINNYLGRKIPTIIGFKVEENTI